MDCLYNSRHNKLINHIKRKKGWYIFLLTVIVVLGSIIAYFECLINPVIYSVTEMKVQSLAQKAINGAVADVVSDSLSYDDLVGINVDGEGKVTYIKANSLLINKLTKKLVKASQEKLEDIGKTGIDIPIGSFTGIPFLVGRGNDINLKMLPIGAISCNFTTEFTSAGINQTNHKIYLNVNANLSVIFPLENRRVNSSIQVLVCENIIVGDIPQTYLYTASEEDMLDLLG